jgi:hypothetical protein
MSSFEHANIVALLDFDAYKNLFNFHYFPNFKVKPIAKIAMIFSGRHNRESESNMWRVIECALATANLAISL